MQARDFSRVRGVGSIALGVEAAVGTLLVVRYGRRLGSASERPDDLLPESTLDSLMVIGVLVAAVLVAVALFRLAGRRWERGRTDVDPAAAALVGIVFVASATGLAYQSQVVPFMPPTTTFAEGRAVLDALVGSLTAEATPQGRPPGDGVSIQADGPPSAAAMAALLEGGAEPCRDGVGRDMGSISLVWEHRSLVVVPLSTLEGLQWRGNAIIEPVLPLGYVTDFREVVYRALRVSDFAVVDTSDEYTVRVSGTRVLPDAVGGPVSYSFDTQVRLVGQLPERQAQVEAQMTLRSPCLRVT